MSGMNPLLSLALVRVASLVDKAPEAKDVKAGWLAFGIFLLLILATAFLCLNFLKQLRKAQAAKDAGAFGDEPVSADSADGEPVTPDDKLEG